MTNQTTATDVEFDSPTRLRAFNCQLAPARVSVGADGIVRVFDPVAGHFTGCHTLDQRTTTRLRNFAKGVRA